MAACNKREGGGEPAMACDPVSEKRFVGYIAVMRVSMGIKKMKNKAGGRNAGAWVHCTSIRYFWAE